jgi:hypothetical protein
LVYINFLRKSNVRRKTHDYTVKKVNDFPFLRKIGKITNLFYCLCVRREEKSADMVKMRAKRGYKVCFIVTITKKSNLL